MVGEECNVRESDERWNWNLMGKICLCDKVMNLLYRSSGEN